MIDSRVRLNLDVRETGMPQTVEAKRGDTGRVLLITLSDSGVPYSISADCYGVFTARKGDGTVLYDPCSIENNVIAYTFTEQTCAAVGAMPAEIRLYGSGGKLLTSACFVLEVRDTVWHEGDLVSQDQMDALDALVLELIELKHQLEQNPGGGFTFRTDETLTLRDGILSVNTINHMEQDNTLPITSAGVYAAVGNIEALLKTI